MYRPATVAKADVVFGLYYQMGAERSLRALRDLLGKVGVRISDTTLERWSQDFAWQARIAEIDQRASEMMAERQAADVAAMNRRQAGLGKAMQDIATFTLANMSGVVLDPREAAKFAETGIKIERLAMGEATTRNEIAFKVYSELLVHIEALWLEVNAIADATERDRRFRIGIDSLIDASAAGALGELRDSDVDLGATAPAAPTQ